MSDHPNIIRRMANGDESTADWLASAIMHKITKGESKGAWIAWKPGKMAYITADHPKGLGCSWYDWPQGLQTLEKAIALAESEAL
jgi:hypothetical protein